MPEDFRLEQASSAERALELIERRTFDLILLDINMSGMGGIEACRRIRTFSVPAAIVMVTVRDEESDIVQALEAGADDYITKPFRLASWWRVCALCFGAPLGRMAR